MEQRRDDKKTPDQDCQPEAGKKPASRKPYVSPVLVEYGSNAKLTQGAKTQSFDGANSRLNMACL